jgi:hypothetical protein
MAVLPDRALKTGPAEVRRSHAQVRHHRPGPGGTRGAGPARGSARRDPGRCLERPARRPAGHPARLLRQRRLWAAAYLSGATSTRLVAVPVDGDRIGDPVRVAGWPVSSSGSARRIRRTASTARRSSGTTSAWWPPHVQSWSPTSRPRPGRGDQPRPGGLAHLTAGANAPGFGPRRRGSVGSGRRRPVGAGDPGHVAGPGVHGPAEHLVFRGYPAGSSLVTRASGNGADQASR